MKERPEKNKEKKRLQLAGCIIQRDGTMLLIHRKDPDQWEMPGGKLEKGETLQQAAKRELREELEHKVHKPWLFHTTSCSFFCFGAILEAR